jgi:hypothetical protein
MNQEPLQGVNRQGLDAAFEAEEARKSNLLLEAQVLRERQADEAATKFAEAAGIEELLSETCVANGLTENSFVHRFSAASCWAQAGTFYQAIALCEELLARRELPERLRQRVHDYALTLRARRTKLYSELALVS